jgi:hypothetical protein
MERRRRKDRIGGAGPTTLMLQNTPRSTAAGRAFVDRGPDRSLLTES